MADQRITLTLPAGIFVYPKLDTPDVFVHPKTGKKGDPTYILNTAYEGDTLKQVQKVITDAAKKLTGEKNPTVPFRTIKSKKGDEYIVLVAKTKRKDKQGNLLRPLIVDAKNKKLPDDVSIGGGTKGKPNITLSVLPDGDGVHAYLNAVQVLDLKEANRSPFDQTEGFEYGAEGEASSGDNDSPPFDTDSADSGDAYKF